MERFCCILFICSVFIVSSVQGQENKHSGVVVHADPRLSVLLKKSKVNTNTERAARPITEANVPKVAVAGKTPPTPILGGYLTAPRKAGVIYSGKGFRVQIYNGPDRAKAVDIKREFMRRNPGVRTYLTYVSPAFRVKVGNYRNRSDAEGMYREAKSAYTPCMIVPDIITISTF
jgi:sporulation related protein